MSQDRTTNISTHRGPAALSDLPPIANNTDIVIFPPSSPQLSLWFVKQGTHCCQNHCGRGPHSSYSRYLSTYYPNSYHSRPCVCKYCGNGSCQNDWLMQPVLGDRVRWIKTCWEFLIHFIFILANMTNRISSLITNHRKMWAQRLTKVAWHNYLRIKNPNLLQ